MKVINDKTATKGAPDPEALEFVGSVPAASKGTISTWSNATWSVTTGGVTQTQDVSISPGAQQKLNVADAPNITLANQTTYDVTVKYEATDAVANMSDANTFKTAPFGDGWYETGANPLGKMNGPGLLAFGNGLFIGVANDALTPVSYTHLTLPTTD